jgi:dynein assembly factor with WDR repeat domains 1
VLWDFDTGEVLLTLKEHQGEVFDVEFGSDDAWMFSVGGDQLIRRWDLSTDRAIGQLRGHQGEIYAVVLDRTGNRLLTASADHTIRLWRLDP